MIVSVLPLHDKIQLTLDDSNLQGEVQEIRVIRNLGYGKIARICSEIDYSQLMRARLIIVRIIGARL